MRLRAASLAAAAAIWLAAAGCRRAPLADGRDAAADHPAEAPSQGDGLAGPPDAPPDAVADFAPGDAAPPDGSAAPRDADAQADAADAPRDTTDASNTADAPRDAADAPASTDAPPDLPGAADRPADLATSDAPADRVPGDAADASDARPQDQPCGPLGLYCAPFACDVARGICKSTCASDDDCTGGRPCRNGLCGSIGGGACVLNSECNSGFCSQGVCCNTACNGICRSCAFAGTVGVCVAVPAGAPDPMNRCPGENRCDGTGQCLNVACTSDDACATGRLCSEGRCIPCSLTCASTAACTSPAVCWFRNGCSYCAPLDAGAN